MKNTILKQSAAVLLAMSLVCGTATAGYAGRRAAIPAGRKRTDAA